MSSKPPALKVVRCRKGSPTDAWRAVNRARERKGVSGVDKSAVHRYVRGETHRRGQQETRGRKRALSARQVRSLDTARVRLLRKADNDHRVTYADVQKEAGLASHVCKRVCEDSPGTPSWNLKITGA